MENKDKDEIIEKLESMVKDLEIDLEEKDSKLDENAKTIKELNEEVLILNGVIKILQKDAATIARLKARVKHYFEISSEKQPWLFNEFETTAENGTLEETSEETPYNEETVNSYVRKKARTGINLPADIPVIDIYDDTEIQTCSRCGSPMKKVGEKVYESFTRICKEALIRKHVNQYECTNCEPEANEGRIIETPVTGNMLDGTVCDPTLFSQIVENKFSYAMTLYRQAHSFQDIGLSRFTMSSWLIKIGKKLEKNMAPCLEKLIYSYPLINTDETPVKVLNLLDEDGNKKAPDSRTNAWMIVRAATDSKGRQGPVMFTFTDNRRNDTLVDILKPYTGVVQTDGLYGYANAAKVCSFTHIGCMVHSRRKAIEAKGKSTSGISCELVKIYGDFFHHEGLLKDQFDENSLSEEEYVIERRRVLSPILDKLKKFCEENLSNSYGKLQTALSYPLDHWESLIKFLDYPYATSSNQRAENAIRPFCLGRKNWLFTITELSSTISAFYYSLVESCKSLGINFQDYMTYVLLHANTIPDGDEEAWTNLLPGKCDISSAKAYKEKLFTAKPNKKRKEVYKLRGKRV